MKKCVLYDGKVCNDCGECNRCDLDPGKICDNCGKCLQRGSDEFNSIIYRYPAEDENECECGCECDHHENGEELNSADFDEFLDEPIELGVPDPIQIDPALAAEWERRGCSAGSGFR